MAVHLILYPGYFPSWWSHEVTFDSYSPILRFPKTSTHSTETPSCWAMLLDSQGHGMTWGISFWPKRLLLKSCPPLTLIHQCSWMDMISLICFLYPQHQHPPPTTWPHPPGRPLHSLRVSSALGHPQPRLPRIFHFPEPLWGSEGKISCLAMYKSDPSQPHPVQPTQASTCIGRSSSHPGYPITLKQFWSLWYFQLFVIRQQGRNHRPL